MVTKYSFLEEAGIQISCLLSNEDLPRLSTVTNGIVLELFVLHKKYNLPAKHIHQWLQQLLGATEMPHLSTLRKSITALNTRRQKLAKSSENAGKVEAMLQAEYQLPRSRRSSLPSSAAQDAPCKTLTGILLSKRGN